MTDPLATCPKCARPREPAEAACARCGLVVTRWIDFAREQAAAEPPELGPLWERAAAAWDDPAAHDKLLAVATELGVLPSLARRYRGRAGDPVAEKRLAQIAALVEAAARMQVRSEASPRAARGLWIAGYAVAAVLVAASLWFLFRLFQR